METNDLRALDKELYHPSTKTPVIVEVPHLRYLMIDGSAEPGGDDFQARMQALFSIAYPLKFAARKQLGIHYPVMPPEGLFWDPSGKPLTDEAQNATMLWTLMIVVPEQISVALLNEVCEAVKRKKGAEAGPVDEVVLKDFAEGTCVQLMHLGPYDQEAGTIERMREFAAGQGYELTGKHHEIYIGDPSKGKPEKVKTILRHPIRKASGPA